MPILSASSQYVGQIVSDGGIATDLEKVEVEKHWKESTNLKSLRSFLGFCVRSFLGFCGYYHRFIATYSAIIHPLTELKKGYPPTCHEKKEKRDPTKAYFKESEPFGEHWTQYCQHAFKKVIKCLMYAPALVFALPTKPYILHVDASTNGLGAVLNQEYPDGLRPVAFAS